MRHALSAVWVSFTTNYGIYTQYRAEFLLYMMAGITPLVMMFVWMSLAEAGATGGADATWFAAYFLVVYGVRQFNAVWVIRELDELVRLGRLSSYLMHPVNPYWRLLGWHFADVAIRAPVVFVFVPVALWLSGGYHELSPVHAPVFIVAVLGGMTLHFHLQYLFGLAAFWTDQSLAFEEFYLTLFYLLGGLVVPLQMFPDALRGFVDMLPWPYIFGFPTELLLGAREGAGLLRGLLIQVGWIAVLVVAGQVVWRVGLRRYAAAGA